MNKKYHIPLGVCLLVILTNCSSIKVVSDLDTTEDFAVFKTFEYYGWAEGSGDRINQLERDRIERAFADEFTKRDMRKVDSNGDVVVALFITGRVRTQTTANTTTTGMGGMNRRGMRSPGWGWGTTHSTTTFNETQFLEGTLMIEMFDPVDKKLIWQAMGTKTIKEDPEKRAKNIPRVVAEIMKKYPVKPTK